MKTAKAVLVLLIITVVMIGGGAILKLISQEQAIDYSLKAAAVLGLVAIGSFLVGLLLGSKKSQNENQNKGSGPQF